MKTVFVVIESYQGQHSISAVFENLYDAQSYRANLDYNDGVIDILTTYYIEEWEVK